MVESSNQTTKRENSVKNTKSHDKYLDAKEDTNLIREKYNLNNRVVDDKDKPNKLEDENRKKERHSFCFYLMHKHSVLQVIGAPKSARVSFSGRMFLLLYHLFLVIRLNSSAI